MKIVDESETQKTTKKQTKKDGKEQGGTEAIVKQWELNNFIVILLLTQIIPFVLK